MWVGMLLSRSAPRRFRSTSKCVHSQQSVTFDHLLGSEFEKLKCKWTGTLKSFPFSSRLGFESCKQITQQCQQMHL